MAGKFISLSDLRTGKDDSAEDIFNENEPRPVRVLAIKKSSSATEVPKIKINLIERKPSDGYSDSGVPVIGNTSEISSVILETVTEKGGWILPVGQNDKRENAEKNTNWREAEDDCKSAAPSEILAIRTSTKMNDLDIEKKDSESERESDKSSEKSRKDKSRRKHKRKRGSDGEDDEKRDSVERETESNGRRGKHHSKPKHRRKHDSRSSSIEQHSQSDRRTSVDKKNTETVSPSRGDKIRDSIDAEATSTHVTHKTDETSRDERHQPSRSSRLESRDRSRERLRNRSRDALREKSRERSRHSPRRSSRYESERRHKSSHKYRERSRDRDRSRKRDRSRSRERRMSKERSKRKSRDRERNPSRDRRRSRSRDDGGRKPRKERSRSQSFPRQVEQTKKNSGPAAASPLDSYETRIIARNSTSNLSPDRRWEMSKLPDETRSSMSPSRSNVRLNDQNGVTSESICDQSGDHSMKGRERSILPEERRLGSFSQQDIMDANDFQGPSLRSRNKDMMQGNLQNRTMESAYRDSSPVGKSNRDRNSPGRYKERSQSIIRCSNDRPDSRNIKRRDSRSRSRGNDRSSRPINERRRRSASRSRGKRRSHSRERRNDSRRIREWPEPHMLRRNDERFEDRRPNDESRASDRSPKDASRSLARDEMLTNQTDPSLTRFDDARRSPSINSSNHGRGHRIDDDDDRRRWMDHENKDVGQFDDSRDPFFNDRCESPGREAWRGGRGDYYSDEMRGGRGAWRGDRWRGRGDWHGDERGVRDNWRGNDWRGRGGWRGDDGNVRGGVWRGDGGFRGARRGNDRPWHNDEWRGRGGRGGWRGGNNNGGEFPFDSFPPRNPDCPAIELQGHNVNVFPPQPSWPISMSFGGINDQRIGSENAIIMTDETKSNDTNNEPKASSSAITVVLSQKSSSVSYNPLEPTGDCSPATDTEEDRARDEENRKRDQYDKKQFDEQRVNDPTVSDKGSVSSMNVIPNIHEPPPNFFAPGRGLGVDFRLSAMPGGAIYQLPPPGFDSILHRYPPRAMMSESGGVNTLRPNLMSSVGPHRPLLLSDPTVRPSREGMHPLRPDGPPSSVIEGLARHPLHPGGPLGGQPVRIDWRIAGPPDIMQRFPPNLPPPPFGPGFLPPFPLLPPELMRLQPPPNFSSMELQSRFITMAPPGTHFPPDAVDKTRMENPRPNMIPVSAQRLGILFNPTHVNTDSPPPRLLPPPLGPPPLSFGGMVPVFAPMHYQHPPMTQSMHHSVAQHVSHPPPSDDSTIPLNPDILPTPVHEDPRFRSPEAVRPTDPRSRQITPPPSSFIVDDIYADGRSVTSSPLEDEQDYEPVEIYREDSAAEFNASLSLKEWNVRTASAAPRGAVEELNEAIVDNKGHSSIRSTSSTGTVTACNINISAVNNSRTGVGNTDAAHVDSVHNPVHTSVNIGSAHGVVGDNTRVPTPPMNTIYSARYGRRAGVENASDNSTPVSSCDDRLEDKFVPVTVSALGATALAQSDCNSLQSGVDISTNGALVAGPERLNVNRLLAALTANTTCNLNTEKEAGVLHTGVPDSSTTLGSEGVASSVHEQLPTLTPPVVNATPAFTFPLTLHQLFSSAGIAGSLLLPSTVATNTVHASTEAHPQPVEENQDESEVDSPRQSTEEPVRTSLLPQIWPPSMPTHLHTNKPRAAAVEKGRLDHVSIADLKMVLASVKSKPDGSESSSGKAGSSDKSKKEKELMDRVVEEVKTALKPHYAKASINKEEYKDIMRRAVPKICHGIKNGEIISARIQEFVDQYVMKITKSRRPAGSARQK